MCKVITIPYMILWAGWAKESFFLVPSTDHSWKSFVSNGSTVYEERIKREDLIVRWWHNGITYDLCLHGRGCRDHDRMVIGFTTTYTISAYRHWCCGFNSHSGRCVQHYVIKFVSDLQQVCGFLRVLWFPPPI